MAHAHQTIRIRVNRNRSGGSYKPCGTCGGTGIVRNGNSSKPTRMRTRK